jgi:hypothetical protein
MRFFFLKKKKKNEKNTFLKLSQKNFHALIIEEFKKYPLYKMTNCFPKFELNQGGDSLCPTKLIIYKTIPKI